MVPLVRNFRRLPPLLRVASIAGLVFPLGSIALLVSALITGWVSFPQVPAAADFNNRVLGIALNLGMLSGACSYAVNTYSLRFRQPDWGPRRLSSWQSQVRAIARLAALPLCGIALALILPPIFPVFSLVLGITLLAAIVLLVAHVQLLTISGAVSSSPMRPPQTP